MYVVSLRKSHSENDCDTKLDFLDFKEAREAYRNPWEYFCSVYFRTEMVWIMLDGPNCHMERANPDYKPKNRNALAWFFSSEGELL
jgi:hypothetical protein